MVDRLWSVEENRERELDYNRDYENSCRSCANVSDEFAACVCTSAAIVTGKTHTKGVSGGKPFDFQFQFTDTFVKDGGRWRLLAGHVSKLPAKESTAR